MAGPARRSADVGLRAVREDRNLRRTPVWGLATRGAARPPGGRVSDLSERFAETLSCGCERHAGTVFPCPAHATPHSQHRTPAPGCFQCEDDLADARALAADEAQP